MAQFARPNFDVQTNSWAPTPASPTTLFTKVDEVVVDDGDYISSPAAPAGAAQQVELRLSTVTDPLSSAGHTVRYRISKDVLDGGQIDINVRLMQGAVVIAQWTHVNVSNSPVTYEQLLTGVEADSITDYADLRLLIIPTQV